MQNTQMYIWVGLVLIGLFVLLQIVKYPKQVLWKLVKTAVLGLLFVFAVNWVGQSFHYHLPLNAFTAATAGILGIPGVAALVALHVWLFPS